MFTVDQLCRDIGIKNPFDRPTCIGYGKAKPTCGNLVAESSRSAARAGLQGICQLLDGYGSITVELSDELENVAGLLHCKRWHQYQAEEKAAEWKRRLRVSIAQRDAETRGRQSRTTQEPRRRDSNERTRPPLSVRQSLASHTDEDILAELARRLSSSHGLVSRVAAVMENYYRTYRQTRRSASSFDAYPPAAAELPANDGPDDEFSDYYSQDPDTDTDTDDTSSSYAYQSTPPGFTSPPASQQGTQLRSVRSPAPSPSSASNSSSRSSHSSGSSVNECGICLSRFSTRSTRWRCGTCHNATHRECFDRWVAGSDEDNVRCIYW